MKNEPLFYASSDGSCVVELICGNGGGQISCCSEQLTLLTANTSEGASEKHLPVVEQNGNNITVKVGSIYHPMEEKHSIGWVYLHTQKGGQRVCLQVEQEPVACFVLAEGDSPIAAYAYCNLHGLWKTEING